jgi:hypothetical protein
MIKTCRIDLAGTENNKPLHHHIELIYPEIYTKEKTTLEVSMCHTRAADSVRISYDSDRDGWVIEQASIFSWDKDDSICDPDWQEVSFIQAWGRAKEGTFDDD